MHPSWSVWAPVYVHMCMRAMAAAPKPTLTCTRTHHPTRIQSCGDYLSDKFFKTSTAEGLVCEKCVSKARGISPSDEQGATKRGMVCWVDPFLAQGA